ncbi:cobalamin biosynthesis protein CbiX [Ruegeria sediminis]|uniref:Cobalamin biosynthesis protein CbiX n=1 Tax=Ruegeria sediminis TaxID=2583820 RepID=A0ABY2WYS1_9RHOB|nr:CbiX/SirB N-terminal domain-containing protein [Ruegeria sediminis]TMV08019.1 cobalamin biosynthesis protein CbiX [Ruegeria sediminis]
MPHAVIVAHGQPSDPKPAEAALRDFAGRVGAASPGVTVHSATLSAPKRLETVLDGLPADTVIYPLFMAKGWFVTDVLPKRLGSRSAEILDPLGVDPALPALVADALLSEMQRLGWVPQQTDLVLAAHGSGRSRNPAEVARDFAGALAERLSFASIRLGFVEQEPSITDAARGAGVQALCLPFFACQGGHALEDVPMALSDARYTGRVLPVLGDLPPVPPHIGSRLTRHFAARA